MASGPYSGFLVDIMVLGIKRCSFRYYYYGLFSSIFLKDLNFQGTIFFGLYL
ncbi:hypothetical protein [uncultured Draconibacterium sp.]|uniref:hypothetical protein n=1 Tax=uncultured Draconibacterium sp. TaxID=1573823 RepID=UPI0025CB9EB7|nr:hypothetical protein [uncultured Draconibacterium sp.]